MYLNYPGKNAGYCCLRGVPLDVVTPYNGKCLQLVDADDIDHNKVSSDIPWLDFLIHCDDGSFFADYICVLETWDDVMERLMQDPFDVLLHAQRL